MQWNLLIRAESLNEQVFQMCTLHEIDLIRVYLYARKSDMYSLRKGAVLFAIIMWTYVLYMNCLCLFLLTQIYSIIYVDGCEESEI
jgi:hypothetical protein